MKQKLTTWLAGMARLPGFSGRGCEGLSGLSHLFRLEGCTVVGTGRKPEAPPSRFPRGGGRLQWCPRQTQSRGPSPGQENPEYLHWSLLLLGNMRAAPMRILGGTSA